MEENLPKPSFFSYFRSRRLIILSTVMIILLIVALLVFKSASKHKSPTLQPTLTTQSKPMSTQDTEAPSLKLKSIGFNLDYYSPVTNMAGEMRFTHYNFFADQIWSDFGQQDPRTPDPTKKNPQPTFALPLETKVQSLVDGEVIRVTTLYSGDVSIMVAKDKDSPWIYETEHVINPRVKVGDFVTAGQIIADVSPHGSPGPGLGILEIGILHPVNTQAGHVCPFKYLDDSIKADIQAKITALHKSWESYIGKIVYKEKFISPGCVTEDWVKG